MMNSKIAYYPQTDKPSEVEAKLQRERTAFNGQECERLAEEVYNVPWIDVGDCLVSIFKSTPDLFPALLELLADNRENPYDEDYAYVMRRALAWVAEEADKAGVREAFEEALSKIRFPYYPTELTVTIPDGARESGGRLAIASYRGTELFVECGSEFSTEAGTAIRNAILTHRFDACIVPHCPTERADFLLQFIKEQWFDCALLMDKTILEALKRLHPELTEYELYFAHEIEDSCSYSFGNEPEEITVTPVPCDCGHSALLIEAGGRKILCAACGEENFTELIQTIEPNGVIHLNGDGDDN